jgi:NADH/F420H2 dehydrogenase subunit C
MLGNNDIRTVLPHNGGNPQEKFGALWSAQIEGIRQRFGQKISEVLTWPSYPTDVPILFVAPAALLELMQYLQTAPDCAYSFLVDLTATDEKNVAATSTTQGGTRFHVIYNLLSHKHNFARIRVKVKITENESVPSLIPLWVGADWAEREVWDMFGIKFDGHPNLRRILMDERWEGHPLRKDYPLKGYQSFQTPQQIHPDML